MAISHSRETLKITYILIVSEIFDCISITPVEKSLAKGFFKYNQSIHFKIAPGLLKAVPQGVVPGSGDRHSHLNFSKFAEVLASD